MGVGWRPRHRRRWRVGVGGGGVVAPGWGYWAYLLNGWTLFVFVGWFPSHYKWTWSRGINHHILRWMMIGVYNHLRKVVFLGSITILRRWARIHRDGTCVCVQVLVHTHARRKYVCICLHLGCHCWMKVCVCACFFVDPTCFLMVEKITRKSLFAKVSDLPRLGSYWLCSKTCR